MPRNRRKQTRGKRLPYERSKGFAFQRCKPQGNPGGSQKESKRHPAGIGVRPA